MCQCVRPAGGELACCANAGAREPGGVRRAAKAAPERRRPDGPAAGVRNLGSLGSVEIREDFASGCAARMSRLKFYHGGTRQKVARWCAGRARRPSCAATPVRGGFATAGAGRCFFVVCPFPDRRRQRAPRLAAALRSAYSERGKARARTGAPACVSSSCRTGDRPRRPGPARYKHARSDANRATPRTASRPDGRRRTPSRLRVPRRARRR